MQRTNSSVRYERLLTEEPKKKPPQPSPVRSSLTKSHTLLLGFIAGTLCTLSLVLLTYFLFASPLLSASLCVTPYHKQTTFSAHPEFANLSHKYDALWEGVLPSNGGFLNHIGPDGTQVGEGITMFHQLHCLQLLRIGLQQKHSNGEEAVPVVDGHGHSVHANSEHYLHCLDYLRQVSRFD